MTTMYGLMLLYLLAGCYVLGVAYVVTSRGPE